MQEKSEARGNLIVALSISLLFVSVYLFTSRELEKDTFVNNLVFETINIKNISVARIAYKDGSGPSVSKEIQKENSAANNVQTEQSTQSTVQQMSQTSVVKWQLPTARGRISQYPSYYHVALDITSPNGVYETIYPVAPGTITNIYKDSAGAKIITIHHYINGKNYTSQYVHLSSYASGLYVGKYVTVHDPLGQMGSTGVATGVHLHITVADCILFNPNDSNCKDLNSFFRYIKIRYNQGFKGLSDLTYVPNSW